MLSASFSDSIKHVRYEAPQKLLPVETGHFSRTEAQDILDAAQIEAGRLYIKIPSLCEPIQSELRQALEKCNHVEVDPMQILHEQMRLEWQILDAYNRHRLGRAAHRRFKSVSESNDLAEYDKLNSIPDLLEYFPLRREVSLRGIEVSAPPLYQFHHRNDEHLPRGSATATKTTKETKVISRPISKANGDTPSSNKKRQGRGAENYDKLADAPTSQLDFPAGNITIAELLCFIPQCIKSWDIIDRFLHNGALTVTLTDMINHFRLMPHGPITNNSVYRMMKGPMNRRAEKEPAYKGWSVSKHRGLRKPKGYDPASISVDGFQTPINNSKREAAVAALGPAPRILFRDLANGVKIMPTGQDALDLTRCVRYCLSHLDEDWYYPQDFVELVSQLPHDPKRGGHLCGPSRVQVHHQDEHIINRYTSRQKQDVARKNFDRPRDSNGRLAKLEGGKWSDEDNDQDEDFDISDKRSRKRKRATTAKPSEESDLPIPFHSVKRRKSSSKSAPGIHELASSRLMQSRRKKAVHVEDCRSEFDGDVFSAPTSKGKPGLKTRGSTRINRFKGSYNVAALRRDVLEVETDGEDVRGDEDI